MKNRVTIIILTIVMIFAFVQTPSFALDTDYDTGDVNVVTDSTQDFIVCDADVDPSLRQISGSMLRAASGDSRIAAHTKVREILDNYADADFYKSNDFGLTQEEESQATAIALEATSKIALLYISNRYTSFGPGKLLYCINSPKSLLLIVLVSYY